MELLAFAEINLICIAICVILFFSLKDNIGMMLDEKIFRILLLLTVAVLLCDAGGWLTESQPYEGAKTMCYIADALYYALNGIASAFWFSYVECKLYDKMHYIVKYALIVSVPALVVVVLAAVSPWTGSLFYLDGANVYHRGSLFYAEVVITWGYIFAAAVLAIVKGLKEKNGNKKKEDILLGLITLFPIVGGVIQVACYGVPLIWVCATLALLMYFVSMQNRQISTDELTQVHNRRFLNRYLEDVCGGNDPHVYLTIIDVDDFKQINDKFGHVEGDNALILVAEAMKQVIGKKGDLLARYGGDEFAIISHQKEENELEKMLTDVQEMINEKQKNRNAEYDIILSIGYAEFHHQEGDSVDALLRRADDAMYRVKSAKKLHKRITAIMKKSSEM